MSDPMVPLVWTDTLAAGVIAEAMEEQGIPVQLEEIKGGFFTNPMGTVRIHVPKSRAPSAMAVLEYLREKHPNMKLDFTGRSEVPPPV